MVTSSRQKNKDIKHVKKNIVKRDGYRTQHFIFELEGDKYEFYVFENEDFESWIDDYAERLEALILKGIAKDDYDIFYYDIRDIHFMQYADEISVGNCIELEVMYFYGKISTQLFNRINDFLYEKGIFCEHYPRENHSNNFSLCKSIGAYKQNKEDMMNNAFFFFQGNIDRDTFEKFYYNE